MGALCAITAKDDDAESAMLASWISQVRAYCADIVCEAHPDCFRQQVLQHKGMPSLPLPAGAGGKMLPACCLT